MSDFDALRAAVAAAPDDDTPRLVAADYLEEHGDPGRAEFVRAQCRVAAEGEWEPFGVLCRRRRTDWVSGDPWRSELPPFHGVTWPETAFRRGFGWAAGTTFLPALVRALPDLLSLEPVQRLVLPTAPLDHWVELANVPDLAGIRSVLFSGTRTPIEPLRVFGDAPFTTGLREIEYHAAGKMSVPQVIADLLPTPLGRRLESLTLKNSSEPATDLIEAIVDGRPTNLRRLNLTQMNVSATDLEKLGDVGLLTSLVDLDLSLNPTGSLAVAARCQSLQRLVLANATVGVGGAEALAAAGMASLRSLNLSNNRIGQDGHKLLARSKHLAGLRELILTATIADNASVRFLTRGTFWRSLVSLDLRMNPISDGGARHLMSAEPADELTSLVLPSDNLSDGMMADLRAKFGDTVAFVGNR